MTFGLSLVRERIQRDARGTRDWRNSCAQKFPTDKRNVRAAERLAELATSEEDVDTQVLSKISSHRRFKYLQPAVSAACRDVGFRFEPASLDDLFSHVLVKLDDETIGGKN